MTTAITLCTTFALGALTLALVVCFAAVVRGPSLADRVLAVDLLTISGAGLMGVTGIALDDDVFLDTALILIATGFVSTAAFAQFIERKRGGPPS
jgi:multicomponent Na+:H+ antiporter subunit F